jgi:methionyl-tRNA formyltransferase
MNNLFKVGFFGDDIWAHNILKLLLLDKTIKVCFVCGRLITKDNILKKIADKNKIQFFKLRDVNSKKFLKYVKKNKIDLLVSMSYDQIFKNEIIDLVKKKIINCHAGKLPFYRGRSILNWVLINGEKEFGITTHFVNKEIDKGNIINQKVYKIGKKDDFKSLIDKSYLECPKLLYKSIKQIQTNKYKSIPQRKLSKKFSYFTKRKNGDEVIDLNLSANAIQNFVRGLVEPGPFARIKLKNNLIYVKRISIINKKNYLAANTLFFENRKIYFLSGDKKIIRVNNWSSNKKITDKKEIKLK